MTRLLVTLDGGMERDVVGLIAKRLVVSEIKRLADGLQQKAVVVAACICIFLCASFLVVMNCVRARLHEHRLFLGEMEDATAPAAPRKP